MPARYRLAALVAAAWSLLLLAPQTYVFARPDVPRWLAPLEPTLRSAVDQAAQLFPTLDPYYTFGRLFFPAYLLLAYAWFGVHRAQRASGHRVRSLLAGTALGASAVGGLGDALMYWGGDDPDLGSLEVWQLGGWLAEEISLLLVVAATVGIGVAVARARTTRWKGSVVALLGVLALPFGLVTYLPHGVVLVLAVAAALMASGAGASYRAGG